MLTLATVRGRLAGAPRRTRVAGVDREHHVAPRLTAIEYLVTDLDRALELFTTIGFPVQERTRHTHFDAELAVLDADPVAIVLLSPTDTGSGTPIPLPEDRLSQLVFETEDPGTFADLRERLVAGGASVAHDGAEMFHLSASLMEAVFGNAPPLVFTTMLRPASTGAPQGSGQPVDPTEPVDP